MIKGMHHIGVIVESLTGSLPFYVETLGFSRLEEMEIPGRVKIVMLSLGELRLELLEYATPLEENKNSGQVSGLAHLALEVAEIERTMDALKEKGVEFIDAAPRSIPNGNRVAFCKGPDHVLIELVEKKKETE